MEQKSAREIQQALTQPFAPEDLEWRLQITNKEKTRGLAVPYVTNRAIQNRLDDVVGADHWYNKYKPWHRFTVKVRSDRNASEFEEREIISQLCGIAIYFESCKEWITKWDGAEDTDIEQVKGGLSDSMKRAAVQWGIGRILYSMDPVWVNVEQKGRSIFIMDGERPNLDKAYLNMLARMGLTAPTSSGLKSLLTPKNTAEAPQAGEQPKAPDHSQATTQNPPLSAGPSSDAPQSQTPAPLETPDTSTVKPQPTYEYVVLAAKVQQGMKSSNTQVMLESADGKRVQAFARGARPELAVGVCLTAVKLTLHRQDTVAYYVLEGYTLVELQDQAA